MSDPGRNFLHLNRDGHWPGFAWRALDVGPGGALTLASLPSWTRGGEAARAFAALPAPDGPAGLAVAPDGTVWWTDPRPATAGPGRLLRRDPCDGREVPAPLDPDAALVEPRGLAVHPLRGALVIADAGRHLLLLVALDSLQLVDLWGGPGTGPGRFDRPSGVAVGGDGALFVVDAGNHRVQKLDFYGAVDPGFEAAVATSAPDLHDPAAVAVDGERVWVLDGVARALFAFDLGGARIRRLDLALGAPAGLAAIAGALYVGDLATRRLLRIDPDTGRTLGEARAFEGPVAALAATGSDLWVHPGGAAPPLRLDRLGAAVRQGVLWLKGGQPVTLAGEPHAWQRLQALGDPAGGRIVFFVHAGGGPPPAPDPARLGEPDGGFSPAAWRPIGEGVGDVLVGERSAKLWIGALFSGDGRGGPRLEQLRLSFDEEGYAQHLPPIYRLPGKVSPGAPAGSREALERFLALFESFFDDVEGEIAGLSRRFDPAAAPPDWLDWLAGWLALALEEAWPEGKRRRLLARAFASYAWRGTARGLTRALADRLGIQASIEEPHSQTDWWVLAEGGEGNAEARAGSRLGLTTRLPPAAPQGAVVGTTAVLDASHLIEEEDVGEPLFTPTAYQFSVVLPRSQAGAPASLARVRELIEGEKPAHATYQLCFVEPGIRVGFQALLGVDTLLGGCQPPPASRLGEPASGGGLVLGGEPPGRLGGSRIGLSTRLGEGRLDVCTGAARPAREETPWAR